MSSGKDFINKYKKQAETAKNKFRTQVDTIAKNPKLTGSQKATQSREIMKKVKTAQNFQRGYANPKTAQSAITLPKDIKTVQSAAKGAITKGSKTTIGKFGLGSTKYATKSGANIAFGKSAAGKLVKRVGLKPLKYGTRAVIKRAGIPGAIIGLGLATPTGRRIAKTVLGGVTGGIIGSQTKKKSTAPTFKKDSQGRDIAYTRTRGFNLSPSATSAYNTTKPKYAGYYQPKAKKS